MFSQLKKKKKKRNLIKFKNCIEALSKLVINMLKMKIFKYFRCAGRQLEPWKCCNICLIAYDGKKNTFDFILFRNSSIIDFLSEWKYWD